jgi:hypothetical protein
VPGFKGFHCALPEIENAGKGVRFKYITILPSMIHNVEEKL